MGKDKIRIEGQRGDYEVMNPVELTGKYGNNEKVDARNVKTNVLTFSIKIDQITEIKRRNDGSSGEWENVKGIGLYNHLRNAEIKRRERQKDIEEKERIEAYFKKRRAQQVMRNKAKDAENREFYLGKSVRSKWTHTQGWAGGNVKVWKNELGLVIDISSYTHPRAEMLVLWNRSGPNAKPRISKYRRNELSFGNHGGHIAIVGQRDQHQLQKYAQPDLMKYYRQRDAKVQDQLLHSSRVQQITHEIKTGRFAS